MRKGFIFDHNRCVDCGACRAACILENGWTIHAREVYTYNYEALAYSPLTNVSLACNHCEKAICMDGCPSSSYFRDPVTNAVLIDNKKCIGCKYCQWNCPYDAPKFDMENRVIGKCNLCYSGFNEGRMPACTEACPTGALKFGDIENISGSEKFPWFPEKNLNPSISFKGDEVSEPLLIIPEKDPEPVPEKITLNYQISAGDWSLIAFSYLSTISVAIIISSMINGSFPNKIQFISVVLLAAVLSLFHLGRPLRAWRAMVNIRFSPLSREILLFALYSALSFVAVIFSIPDLLIFSALIGLIFLVAIDNVYIYSDRRKKVIFHSGQTFISALLIASFLAGFANSFMFIAILKLLYSIYRIYIVKRSGVVFALRFFRIALLIVSLVIVTTGISFNDPAIIAIFMSGELADRTIFYIDFKPVNIKTEILNRINIERDEKEIS